MTATIPLHAAPTDVAATGAPAAPAFALLARMVSKEGVGLGGLSAAHRDAALCLAARALPPASVASEAEVNALLKRFLLGTGSFLRTDHVELRRWLVDTGLWQRDGFGRAYERGPAALRRPELNALWQQLDAHDVEGWVQAHRQRAEQERLQRRQAWLRPAGDNC